MRSRRARYLQILTVTMFAARQPSLFWSNDLEYNKDKDFLGAGGFGEVYKCVLRDSGQQVAIKVLSTPTRLKER